MRMEFPGKLTILWLQVLKYALKTKQRHVCSRCGALDVKANIFRFLRHALQRHGVTLATGTVNPRPGCDCVKRAVHRDRNSPRGITSRLHTRPQRFGLPNQSVSMSRKLSCREQCHSPMLAEVLTDRRPQILARRTVRPRIRAFSPAIEGASKGTSTHEDKSNHGYGSNSTQHSSVQSLFRLNHDQPHHHPSSSPPQVPFQQQQQPPHLSIETRQTVIDLPIPQGELQPHPECVHASQRYEHEKPSLAVPEGNAMNQGRTTLGMTGESSQQVSIKAVPRYKRPAHIDAEYRRRDRIQRGFDLMQSLVPAFGESSLNMKQSKAKVLTKSAYYIRELTVDVARQKTEIEALQEEIDTLQKDLEMYQQQLPTNGLNSVERPSCNTQQVLKQYLQASTAENWKFWIFSFLVRPLSESFTRSVSLATIQQFLCSVQEWSDSHLTLVNLRPIVLSLLRVVSTKTSILTHPDKLQQEILAQMNLDSLTAPADSSRTGSNCHAKHHNVP